MTTFSRSSVHLDVAPSEHRANDPIEPGSPFRILIAGDFSGRANRGAGAGLAGRRALLVDRDNFDTVLENVRPAVRLGGITLEFRELDDFHPDQIYRRTAVFQKLAEERSRPVPPPPQAHPQTPAVAFPGGNLLDQMLDETGEAQVSQPTELTGDLADFLKKVVAPHLEPKADPRQQEQAARADSLAATAMRGLLHHPDFQAVEAAWRALWMLAHRLDTDGDLKIYLFDATLQELAADPDGTRKLFSGGDEPWAVIATNYVFGQTRQDAQLLGILGRVAAGVAPILAEAIPPSEPAAEWEALRRRPEAHWIGLALPRFLLRLPYGYDTAPVESFEFQEMPRSVHRDYLWGNPAFCCAYLLGRTFLSDGWQMRLGTHRQVDGLPLHVYTEGGETSMKPCAEILLTEKDADYLMEGGIMPLASLKGQDAALLVRFQSIAQPLAALSGRWSG